jgi:hypothetical protein
MAVATNAQMISKTTNAHKPMAPQLSLIPPMNEEETY